MTMKVAAPLAAIAVLSALPAAAQIRHSFQYMPPTTARSVALVGSFNQWDKSANPMVFKDGRWTLTLDLPPGEHSYKFVVNDLEYVTDPNAPATGDDGFGGKNGLLRIETAKPKGPVTPRGQLDVHAVRHRPEMPFQNRLGERALSLRIATRPGDLVRATLMVEAKGQWQRTPMKRFASTSAGDYFRASLMAAPGPLRYGFWLEDKKGGRFYGVKGLSKAPRAPYVWEWQKTPAFTTPDWAKGAVFYQIFPERFANGDPSNDPAGVEAWGGKPGIHNHFGGDLAGVMARLDHLKTLGIEGVYFNPLFVGGSNHKYDTWDYMRIDPQFGSNEDYKRLSAAMRQAGMRVMLDGVFNHTGTGFSAFQEAVASGPASPAWNWFTFEGFPVVQEPKPNYKAWWGFSHLPQLNNANPAVRSHLFDVARHWLAPDLADAWRLDVPNEVPRPFWSEFRSVVRGARPDGLIVGEIWADGSPWLKGDNFDSVMNYRFRTAVLDFIAYEKLDSRAFGDALDQVRADYGDQVEHVLFNLLGSHDTERFLNAAKGDKRKLKLAALLQLTYPGMPVVYYGDEVGMTGGADPDNRRTMIWDPAGQDRNVLSHYQALIHLRKAHPALKSGDFERLPLPDPRVYAFRRVAGPDRLVVVINAGSTPFDLATLPGKPTPLYPKQLGRRLPAMSGVILNDR